ncbi:hypothetical protein JKP88DRAFT_349071 [Tribonema minus]|uniref:Uncharacterized protein n=1 Tax=Tribonema minus TaxID=303371 RepID=A0A836CDQ9_9STRA|nr:hypothetical protein JKP88DRAFT_349071 [Tribonema minus]
MYCTSCLPQRGGDWVGFMDIDVLGDTDSAKRNRIREARYPTVGNVLAASDLWPDGAAQTEVLRQAAADSEFATAGIAQPFGDGVITMLAGKFQCPSDPAEVHTTLTAMRHSTVTAANVERAQHGGNSSSSSRICIDGDFPVTMEGVADRNKTLQCATNTTVMVVTQLLAPVGQALHSIATLSNRMPTTVKGSYTECPRDQHRALFREAHVKYLRALCDTGVDIFVGISPRNKADFAAAHPGGCAYILAEYGGSTLEVFVPEEGAAHEAQMFITEHVAFEQQLSWQRGVGTVQRVAPVDAKRLVVFAAMQ